MDGNDSPFRGIVYVFDSLRYDYLGCNGHQMDLTPNIDAVARDGLRCTNAHAQAIWTYPSSGSIFTGLYPETHGSQQFKHPLHDTQPHLGELFADTSVSTACFSTTLGVSPERGFARGFDDFFDLGKGDAGLRPDIMDRLNEHLIPWIDNVATDGFFAVVWAMGVHHPYLTPEDVSDPTQPLENERDVEGTQEWMRRLPCERVEDVTDRYEATVAYSDEKFGELVDTLRDNSVYTDTTLIVTSDHGDLFDEHARLEHAGPYTKQVVTRLLGEERQRYYGVFEPSAFIGHQGIYPYEELLHVPLLVKPATNSPELPVTTEELIELIDVLPTVYDLADQEPPGSIQGHSILDLVAGGESRTYTYSTSQLYNGKLTYRSVFDGTHKLCTKALNAVELSDLFHQRYYESLFGYLADTTQVLLDDTESEPLDSGDVGDALHRALEEHVDRCRAWETTANVATIEVDEMTREHLSDLGYT